MWGAVIGDLAGSIYEYEQTKQITKIDLKEIIQEESFYSDDTILTMAVLEAILNDGDYAFYLRKYGQEFMDYHPDFSPYFKRTFSPGFSKWVQNNKEGNSLGNGAMMRIAPVGYLFNTEKEVREHALKATIPSHNSLEARKSAIIVALIIYYARSGLAKEEIIKKLDLKYDYRPFTKFNATCQETLANCLYALFKANTFNEALRSVISYGGDTDTNACIVGSMAEALYGIPQELILLAKEHIPSNFVDLLDKGYAKVLKINKM